MLLFKVSMPFNPIHAITYILMIVIFVCCYAVPLPNDFLLKMFNLNNHITWDMGKAILAISAVLLPVYVGMSFAMKFLKKKRGEVWERRFESLDARMRVKLK